MFPFHWRSRENEFQERKSGQFQGGVVANDDFYKDVASYSLPATIKRHFFLTSCRKEVERGRQCASAPNRDWTYDWPTVSFPLLPGCKWMLWAVGWESYVEELLFDCEARWRAASRCALCFPTAPALFKTSTPRQPVGLLTAHVSAPWTLRVEMGSRGRLGPPPHSTISHCSVVQTSHSQEPPRPSATTHRAGLDLPQPRGVQWPSGWKAMD